MPSALRVVQKLFPQVTAIKDADECIQIEVTKADDKNGARKDHKTCAMAVACKRQFGCDGVIISVKTAYLIDGKLATRYILFDRKAGFHPGQYQLSKVSPSLKLGPKKVKRHRPHGGSNPRELVHQTAGIRFVLGRDR